MQSSIKNVTNPTASLPAGVKTGKVVGVHRDDHSIDVQFLDGSLARHVPVLSGWLGTTHGAVHLTAPTYDEQEPARKTYPEATGTAVQPPHNEGGAGRDQYACLMQLEGHGFGTSGYVCVGFFAPNVSEMLFPKDDGTAKDAFSDLLLVRHSSDVQSTMDKDGKVSIQHPCGARITIGTGATNLEGKDYDKRYTIRANKTNWKDVEAISTGPGDSNSVEEKASLRLQTAGRADLFGKNNVHIHTKNTTFIDMLDGAGSIDEFATNEIKVRDSAGSIVHVDHSNVHVHAPSSIDVVAGSNVEVEAGASVDITAGATITITAGGIVTITGALILLN
jgi:hypothetical protein